MVKQYPYILKVYKEQEATFDQSTAEWTQGVAEWIEWGKCRDEVSSGGKITLQDGEQYSFSAVVYCPKHIKEINKGAIIQVWNNGDLRLQGEVKRFSKDQLHARIWL